MTELFDEVDEEVRREQLRRIWQRYGWLIIAVAILIVAGVGGWRGYEYVQAQKAAEIGASFEAAIALAEQGKREEAEAAFAKIGATSELQGYRTLARLRAAAELAPRDAAGAAKIYDEVANDRAAGQSEQDLARLRAAGLLLETAAYDDIRQRLEPLTAPGRTFRHSARELLALSAWRNDNPAATRQWIDAITTDAEAPATLRNRAEQLQALLPPAAKT